MTGLAGSLCSLSPHLPGETPPSTYCVLMQSEVLKKKVKMSMSVLEVSIQSDLLSFSETEIQFVPVNLHTLQAQVVCGFTYREAPPPSRLACGKPSGLITLLVVNSLSCVNQCKKGLFSAVILSVTNCYPLKICEIRF